MVTFINRKKIIFICILSLLILFIIIKVKAIESDTFISKNISVNNSSIKLNLKKEYTNTTNKNILAYEDENKNEYAIKDNEIIGFFQKKSILESEIKLSDSKLNTTKTSLQQLISNYSTINLNDYVLSKTSYNGDYNETSYTYSKFINGIKTNDGVIVSINSDGTLASFLAPRQGLFDKLKTSVNSVKVANYVKSVMEKNYSGISYEIKYMTIDYKDNKYIVDSLIVLKYSDYDSTINIYYDL